MSSEIKYIHSIGLSAREIRLIQSFLSLFNDKSQNYEFDSNKKHAPAIIIVDELSHSDEINHKSPNALILVIGEDTGNPDPTYIHRPIQWSKFKTGVEQLKLRPDLTVDAGYTQVVEIDGDKEDHDKSKSYRSDTTTGSSYQPLNDPNRDGAEKLFNIEAPKINSLIEESDEDDDGEMTLTQQDFELANRYEGLSRLGSNINFWFDGNDKSSACQVIVGGVPVLFIQPEKGVVYSEYNFEDWEPLLRSKDARKADLEDDWAPFGKVKSYPIGWLAWTSAHARSKGYLLNELDKKSYFLLNKWPEFDLLFNNNEHMKLCGLMFKEGHSIQELVSKTHIRARVIIGLINACYREGILSSFPDKDQARPKNNQNSVDTHTVMSLLSKVFK